STNWDLWTFDLARGTKSRLTFGPSMDIIPVWSPDGASIAFSTMRNGHFDVAMKAADGSGEETAVVASETDKYVMDWSADGRYLLYAENDPNAGSKADLWYVPVSGDRKPQRYLRTPIDEQEGRFSPDGRWVAYSADESGKLDVFVSPFPVPDGKWQVS